MNEVLLVEDDPQIYEAIAPFAKRAGKRLVWARSFNEAEQHLSQNTPEIALVDRGLPGRSGDELAQRLISAAIPFIMVTARAREDERIAGFDLGADDYVVKPFSAAELMRRIDVALRRRGVRRLVLGASAEIDFEAAAIRVHGNTLALTRTEFKLIERLAAAPERVFTRAELIEILDLDLDTSERALDSHVKNVRKKFRGAGVRDIIHTMVGIGYSLGVRR